MNGAPGVPGLPACTDIPVRPDPPTALEYVAAEYWIRFHYGQHWLNQPPPRLLTWQLERFWRDYQVHDDVLALVMQVLGADFRNPLSPKMVGTFRKLLREGASGADLVALLKEIGPGGYLKPDMLGIAAGAAVEFEAVEVGTVRTAKSTFDELCSKLSIIRDTVVPELKLRLPVLSMSKQMSVPTDIVVRASPWRPTEWQRIMPLPVRVSTRGKVKTVSWICYHPTMAWRDTASPPVPQGAPGGEDGLVLYHIHEVPADWLTVPPRVRAEMEAAIRRYQQASSATLELNPAYAYAFQADSAAFSPEIMRLIGYVGAGLLLVLVLGLAWELGVFAGAAYIAEDGLAVAAATPEELAGALSWGSRLAADLWPQISLAAPLLAAGRR